MEEKAARVLLEQGEPITVPAPFLLRLFGKKTVTFKIYMPSADTCLRAVKYRLRMNIGDKEFENLTTEAALKLFDKYGKDVSRVVAIVILRSHSMDYLFGKWLAKRLLKSLSYRVLGDLMELVTVEGGLLDFMNFIVLMKMMRLMKRNNTSQSAQGS